MLHCFQLQERLQQRREARKRAALDSRQEELRMESSPMPDSVPRSDSVSTMSSMVSHDDNDMMMMTMVVMVIIIDNLHIYITIYHYIYISLFCGLHKLTMLSYIL